MSNCEDICEECGNKVESCDCSLDLTKDQLIELLVSDLIETVKQWAIKDENAELYQFIHQNLGFEDLDKEQLYEQAEGAGLL